MGRRISNGVVGSGGSLGSILVSGAGNTLTTASLNQNLIIDPNGTGVTQIVSVAEMRTAGSLRLYNTANTFYTALSAVAGATSTYTITLPAAVPGGAGYYLTADTSGNCSWSAPVTSGIALTDNTSDTATNYITFTPLTSDTQMTAIRRASTRLSFVPSTGILTATGFSGPLNGTVGATTAAAGSFTTLAASSTVSGTGFSNYLASPPAIGGTLANTGTFSTLSATSITETSSLVLKENFVPIENALDKIIQLTAYIYDRIDGSSKDEPGLIAEDVNKIIPNVVTKDADGNPYGVKYTKLTAYLIEAIKTLKDEIEILKKVN